MGYLLDLPPELLELIVEHLHNNGPALSALSLVSRALRPLSQAQSFKSVDVWSVQYHDGESIGNIEEIRRWISLGPGGAQVLSYTQTLSLDVNVEPPSVYPQELDSIFDYLVAFKNVRELKIPSFASYFVRHPLSSPTHYFAHFRPTLRFLELETRLENPWDLMTFIAFFTLLEGVAIKMLDTRELDTVAESEPEGFEPAALPPFQGILQLVGFSRANTFASELVKARVQYHTLSFYDVTVWTGIQELIVACAPTLRVLCFRNEFCERLPLPIKAGVDRERLIIWDPSRAQHAMASFAEPRRVYRVNGNRPILHQPWKLVAYGAAPRSFIIGIFPGPSKDHSRLRRFLSHREGRDRRETVSFQRVGSSRRNTSAVGCEESWGHRGFDIPLDGEPLEHGARV
jgi:hypothetical protein